MRHDPVFLVFTITSPSWEEAQRLQEKLRNQIEPDAEIIDTCVSSEGTNDVHYRIGDFFEEIAIFPHVEKNASRLRLVFHRRADAGPFWKDIMVRIVHSLETEPGNSVALDHQGDVPLDWMRPMSVK